MEVTSSMAQFPLQRETSSSTLSAVPTARSTSATPSSARQSSAPAARVEREDAATWLGRFLRNLAPQDLYIGGYFVLIMFALALGTGPDRPHCMRLVLVDVACFTAGLALTRGSILRPCSFANTMLYRLTVWLAVFLSYFQLREILPAVSERAIDADIFAFDLRWFHVEPSLAWDRFVTPVTTEWFAFFYFGYFFLLATHVFGVMLLTRNMFRIAHFAMGIFIVFCTGHLIYMLVPGYGPYRFLADRFEHAHTGGLFWSWVTATVHAGGAQKDIFPSLHTAAPTYFALYSYRHRAVAPFKYTWGIVAFCASQIILATMFLRWHYLVDIFAGITLAIVAVTLSEWLVVRDTARREKLRHALGTDAVQPNFSPLDWAGVKRALLGTAPSNAKRA
jgi:hypothetical protein